MARTCLYHQLLLLLLLFIENVVFPNTKMQKDNKIIQINHFHQKKHIAIDIINDNSINVHARNKLV